MFVLCVSPWFRFRWSAGSGQHTPRLDRKGFNARAKQTLVGYAQPAADFTADVHLHQGELLEVLLVDLKKDPGGQLDRRAGLRCAYRCAARKQVHERHLAEAVARVQASE